MSITREEVHTCDCAGCDGKVVVNLNETYVGGHPTNGWWILHRNTYSTAILSSTNFKHTGNQREFCSEKCLKKFVEAM